MTDLPTDYDKEDGFSNEKGCEICPHCGSPWSMNGGNQGSAFDKQGREYEFYINTDPAKGPFFCADCWPELETNQKQSENKTLGEF